MNRRSFLKALGLAPLLAALPALAKVTPLKPQLQRYTGSMFTVVDISERSATISLPISNACRGRSYFVKAVSKVHQKEGMRRVLTVDINPTCGHVLFAGESMTFHSDGTEWYSI